MRTRLTINDIIDSFPDYRVALVVADELRISPYRPASLAAEIGAAEADTADRYSETGMNDIPGIGEWRRAYRGFGIKKTSYRCSVERLVRSCIKGRGLPAINSFVDAYNLVSVRHVMPLGADDLDCVQGALAFRFARPGDSFIALGDQNRAEDPPKEGEVVYADEVKVLCRRWNWYQDGRSPVSVSTTRAVVTVQSLGAGDLGAAITDLERLLKEHSGARVRWKIADRSVTTVEIG
ncbi:MAG: phenylalanine--tRNA ligase beta subunit-related protein [Rhodospirillales bacterium]